MAHYQDVDTRCVLHSGLLPAAVSILMEDEGFRDTPYYCSEGYPTIGYGLRLGPKHTPLSHYQISLPEPVARLWLQQLLQHRITLLDRHPGTAPALEQANLARQVILACMAYQLGINGLAGFKKMLAAASRGDWQDAAREARSSLWAKQTPARAMRYAAALERGQLSWPR